MQYEGEKSHTHLCLKNFSQTFFAHTWKPSINFFAKCPHIKRRLKSQVPTKMAGPEWAHTLKHRRWQEIWCNPCSSFLHPITTTVAYVVYKIKPRIQLDYKHTEFKLVYFHSSITLVWPWLPGIETEHGAWKTPWIKKKDADWPEARWDLRKRFLVELLRRTKSSQAPNSTCSEGKPNVPQFTKCCTLLL